MPRTRTKTKSKSLAPKILPGHVAAVMVRCGKPNCKCASGKLHGPYFYHRTWADGLRSKRYLKSTEVAQVRAACDEHRQLQIKLREGRAQHKDMLARARELFSLLSRAEKEGLI
ncbi:MAG: hypothetical protein QOF02_816 [Blastocatellia bacterium]|jgi:hypothetical protein|nr:hypothetical protein [Blastocatellia bacterium]